MSTSSETAAAPAAAIDIDNLHVAWDADVILHGITARIMPGECVAITGANGSGKSTLMRALLGSAPITAGSARMFGHDLGDGHLPWRRVGYVPQRYASGGGVVSSAIEVVKSGLLGPGRFWSKRNDKARALAALKGVGLASRANHAMQTMSGGQQQRVLIARALVRDPQLLMMDEPMAGIDAHSRERLADVVATAKDAGTTIVVVLHELGELGPLLDRELHISGGHISYDGPPRIDHDDHSSDDHHHPVDPDPHDHALSPVPDPRPNHHHGRH